MDIIEEFLRKRGEAFSTSGPVVTCRRVTLAELIRKSEATESAAPSGQAEFALLDAGDVEAYGDLFTAAFKQLLNGDRYKAAQIFERVAARIRYDESLKSELGI